MDAGGKWGQVVRIIIAVLVVTLSLLPSVCSFIRK
jgi:hypothetical protein